MLNIYDIEQVLISEINLTKIQAKIFLLVNLEGKMSFEQIAEKLGISEAEALNNSKDLIDLGSFIDMSPTEFEAMHPRFTAVNMYRRMCLRKKINFKKNSVIDNIGVALERPYDAARTK